MPLLTQLRLLDEFCKMSKPVRYITVHKENDNMHPMGRVDIEEHIESPVGAPQKALKLKGRKQPNFTLDDNSGLQIETSKGQSFTGDALVGADGAYGSKQYENLSRRFVLSVASRFFQRQNYAKTPNYRPQASFLECVPDRGTIPVLSQKASLRYTEEQAALQRKQQELEEGQLVESIFIVALA
ncbi:hypothetical protein BG015_004193 [Linnemannia schmuckeri]|uniref:Uncharacterized protein n=1 Tax=Linnemannia schmuckeri TaxID=64567 RepID=A0A9P5VCZ7_9FUNG|nr:hypothetical protein BG015_004193 [Linnemannia schmuckeri]